MAWATTFLILSLLLSPSVFAGNDSYRATYNALETTKGYFDNLVEGDFSSCTGGVCDCSAGSGSNDCFRPAVGSLSNTTNDHFGYILYNNNCPNTFGNGPEQKYPYYIEEQGGATFSGVFVQGVIDQDTDFSQQYNCDGPSVVGNSAALFIRGGNSVTVSHARVDKVWDGFRAADLSSNVVNFTFSDLWASDVRDDCGENDQQATGSLENSLFDGCFVGLSTRGAAGDNIGNTYTISGVLLRLKMYLRQGVQTHGQFLKSESGASPTHEFIDSVFAYEDETPFAGISNVTDMFNQGRVGTCTNSYILWLGAGARPGYMNSTNFPASCFTILDNATTPTGAACWAALKQNWIDCHPEVARLDTDPASVPANCQTIQAQMTESC